MKSQIRNIFVVMLFLVCSVITAQIKTINVWEGKIPGSIDNPNFKEDTEYTDKGSPRTKQVTNPTLTVFMAPKDIANGTSVVICPGGGYHRLATPHEGYLVAEWLNTLGISAFVLKYRLPDDAIMVDKKVGPLQDVQESIRIVRRNAKEWGLNPDKIGVMGFSAGGHLAGSASTLYNDKVYDNDGTSARPDFSILVYGVLSMQRETTHAGSHNNLLGDNPDKKTVEHFSSELQVDNNTPPAFLVHADNDKTVPVQNSINYFLALKKNNIPAELHIYERGGHGFGLAQDRHGETEANWPDACKAWLLMNGLL